jgi:S-adenosyl-L-methionine hydrolase (adenosine-forming)
MSLFTITSDLGSANYLTAAVKGCILNNNANAKIIEISSQISNYNIYEAAYVFKNAYSYFKPSTHHFVLCGLYNADNKNLLIAKHNGHYVYFVDNGFAALALSNIVEVYAIKIDQKFNYIIGDIAKTFSLAASYLQQGAAITQFATPYELASKPTDLDPVIHESMVMAQVIYIDNYKNVVVNLTRQEFDEIANGRKVRIEFTSNTQINTVSNHYSDVPIGNKVCFFNNAGYLEIAVRGGNASELFGFETSSGKNDLYNKVTIHFEND